MHVSETRLRENIETNGEFGAVNVDDGRGRTVLTGSPADRKAREYFVERLTELDMDVSVDPVGNILGVWTPAGADPGAAPVVTGSHLDSVPEGGIFDGPLGVYSAVEAVRAIRDSDLKPTRAIGVVAFTEEEGGRFDVGLLGSSVATGKRDVEDALALEADGVLLANLLADIGFRGDDVVDPSAWDAFFELHVEQGTRLEDAGVPVGVVTAITGLTNCEIEIRGEANHAGSTPMTERRDALAAASEFVLDVEDAATEVTLTDSGSAVGTVGKFGVEPNARNVVPGTVCIRTDFRDVVYESMNTLVERARKSLARLESTRDVDTSLDRYRDQQPTPMSERCRDALHTGADGAKLDATDLHSGAGHDTINVADVTDAALMFAPSRDGVSHNPLEWTDWEDCANATRVLAAAVANLATE